MSIVYRSDHRFLPFIPGYCFNFLSLRVLNVYVHCAALFVVVEERKVNVKHSKGNARSTRARACHTLTKRDTRRLVASFPCSPSGHPTRRPKRQQLHVRDRHGRHNSEGVDVAPCNAPVSALWYNELEEAKTWVRVVAATTNATAQARNVFFAVARRPWGAHPSPKS